MVFDEDRTPTWFLMNCEPLDPSLNVWAFNDTGNVWVVSSFSAKRSRRQMKPLGWQQSYGGQGFLSSK